MKHGTIKWFRPDDFTGYAMDAAGNTFYMDRSCCDGNPADLVGQGAPITFDVVSILSRNVAINVRLVK